MFLLLTGTFNNEVLWILDSLQTLVLLEDEKLSEATRTTRLFERLQVLTVYHSLNGVWF